MNPAYADSVRGLAEAAIARVHGKFPDPRADDILMAVLAYAEHSHTVAKSVSNDLGAAMRKAADLGCDPGLGAFSDDLTKAADALGETVALLKAVAAEPQRRFPGEWRGVPLHLHGRAIH